MADEAVKAAGVLVRIDLKGNISKTLLRLSMWHAPKVSGLSGVGRAVAGVGSVPITGDREKKPNLRRIESLITN